MDGPLAVSLDDLPAPYEALTSLKQLDEQGQVGVIEGALVERNGKGQRLTRDESDDEIVDAAMSALGGPVLRQATAGVTPR